LDGLNFAETSEAFITRGNISLGQALLRGRYMAAVARMEWTGAPIDTETLNRIDQKWEQLKLSMIEPVDKQYGVYDGQTFKSDRFERYVIALNIPWKVLESGQLSLDDDYFNQMAKAYPQLAQLRELRVNLSKLRPSDLSIGKDQRNRSPLYPFGSKTGRNQPSSSKFIFGTSRWFRGLIKPSPGFGVAYLDYASQEVVIAAALSGDEALLDAYQSGDPYMAFAIQAGLAPSWASKETHKAERDRCKAIVLGVGYGMGAKSMSQRANITPLGAEGLLMHHKETYRTFWAWVDNNVNIALLGKEISSPMGWPIRYRQGSTVNPRSILNFPMQSGGADILRLATCMATEASLSICDPIHDAVLLEAPLETLERDVEHLRTIMIEASRIVLRGIECRVDVEIVRYPNRYMDERGDATWSMIMQMLSEMEEI
jgi:DNA polymerase I